MRNIYDQLALVGRLDLGLFLVLGPLPHLLRLKWPYPYRIDWNFRYN